VNETYELIHIYVGYSQIKSTAPHPFWVEGKGWVEAGNLLEGDKVKLYSGEVLEIKEIRRERLEEPVKTYNFEVEDWHTYLVSENNVLVHNAGSGKCPGIKSKYSANRPGGYKKGDVDQHGRLSPAKNRAPGNTRSVADNQIRSHHPVQNKWAKLNVPGYNEKDAAAILLPSSSGLEHAKISAAQNARRKIEGYNTSIVHEFNTGFKEMIDAGVDLKLAKKAMKRA